MTPATRRLGLVLGACVALAAGCSQSADQTQVEADLHTRLDRDLEPGLFELVDVRRQGSAPLPAGESGAPRRIVYFNATLRLAKDYAFGSGEKLAPSSVAYALGATEGGLFGLEAQNHSGDIVRAYGTALYEETSDGWVAVAGTATQTASAPPDLEGRGPSLRSKQLIDKLAGMVDLPPPGVTPQQDEIIAEELARASENIERRVQRGSHTYTIATGSAGSEYARFGRSLIEAVNAAAPTVRLRQRSSEGSVDNVRLLSRGEADYAIVQSDVAAAALAGAGVFAGGEPIGELRAVGGLFPEAVHVVVLKDSKIHRVGDLRGRRVDVGPPASGTRFDATEVLDAHGLMAGDLAETRGDGPVLALARLRRKQIDAVFVTSPAPARVLQPLFASPGLRLLSMEDDAIARLLGSRQGFMPLTLAVNTYIRQPQPVKTVGPTALLVTLAGTPDAEVAKVADLVFRRMPAQYANSADIGHLSPLSERRGITIPLHPGAAARLRQQARQ